MYEKGVGAWCQIPREEKKGDTWSEKEKQTGSMINELLCFNRRTRKGNEQSSRDKT